jgi:hypothetical protein
LDENDADERPRRSPSTVQAEKLRAEDREGKPWMKSFGKLRSLRKETARIDAIIEAEFERIAW